jgi:hypothetical protein
MLATTCCGDGLRATTATVDLIAPTAFATVHVALSASQGAPLQKCLVSLVKLIGVLVGFVRIIPSQLSFTRCGVIQRSKTTAKFITTTMFGLMAIGS